MNLKDRLYQFCNENELENLACIVHFSLLNYFTKHPSQKEWVHISKDVLNYFMGIGEDKVEALLDFMTEDKSIDKNYIFSCPETPENHCDSCLEDEIEEGKVDLYCSSCGAEHKFNIFNDTALYYVSYEGEKEKIINDLQINNQDIVNELVVLNTSDDNIERLAEIIVSRLEGGTDKTKAKGKVVKILSSVKDVSGLIAGISEDTSTTVTSLRKIAEDFTGIGTLKDVLSSPDTHEE